MDSLTRHEKLYYNTTQLSPSRRAQTPSKRAKTPISPKTIAAIEFGHERTHKLTPSSDLCEAYFTGRNTNLSPLRIVCHNKRGVKYPRINPEHGKTHSSRNVLGGFYSTS